MGRHCTTPFLTVAQGVHPRLCSWADFSTLWLDNITIIGALENCFKYLAVKFTSLLSFHGWYIVIVSFSSCNILNQSFDNEYSKYKC